MVFVGCFEEFLWVVLLGSKERIVVRLDPAGDRRDRYSKKKGFSNFGMFWFLGYMH